MFVSSPPGEATAAFVKMNESIDDEQLIRDYVGQGLVVRTRSDIPVREARSGDTTRREAALRSGAQWVSTDYPEESPFGSGFIVRLPGVDDGPTRCNPVTAPPESYGPGGRWSQASMPPTPNPKVNPRRA